MDNSYISRNDFSTFANVRFHVVVDKVVKFNKEKDHIVIRGLNLNSADVGVIIMSFGFSRLYLELGRGRVY